MTTGTCSCSRSGVAAENAEEAGDACESSVRSGVATGEWKSMRMAPI
eukprot:SAG31_NODE_2217_length_6168_cov_10.730598_7_plen_47_part_00